MNVGKLQEAQRLLVVGDNILDVDHHCTHERAGILRELRQVTRPGGAGAVAEMVRGLGTECELISHVHRAAKHRFHVDGRPTGHRWDLDASPMGWTREQLLCGEIAASTADRILLSDYGQGTCTDRVIAECMQTGKPVFVDPCRSVPWSRYAGAALLKCNYQQAMQQPPSDVAFPCLVRTRGAAGMDLPAWYGATPSSCVDATGCGDMVLAALGVAWPLGQDFAFRFAMACAGLKCERYGAVPVSPVVLVNGCFDRFTQGHGSLLAKARQLGGVLVGAVNSDKSVQLRNDADRPRRRLGDRLATLQHYCDVVLSFDTEAELEQIVKTLHPVMVKGSDWRGQPVTGESHAREIVWVERV